MVRVKAQGTVNGEYLEGSVYLSKLCLINRNRHLAFRLSRISFKIGETGFILIYIDFRDIFDKRLIELLGSARAFFLVY